MSSPGEQQRVSHDASTRAPAKGRSNVTWVAPDVLPARRELDALQDWWQRNVVPSRHPGAQLALVRDGRLLLQCVGGVDGLGQPIGTESLICVLSITKMLGALVMHHLHACASFDYRDPVVRHWPEFGDGDKAGITIEQVLSHRSGLAPPLLDEYRNWREWLVPDGPDRLIEQLRPRYAPGSTTAYQAQTWGYVVDGLVRRLTGRDTGAMLTRLLSRQATRASLYLGLPARELPRHAALSAATFPHLGAQLPAGGEANLLNAPALLERGLAWGGAVASAAGLAGALQIFAHRGRQDDEALFGLEEWQALIAPRNDPDTVDRRLGMRARWGLGVMVGRSEGVRGTHGPIFGHAAGPETVGHMGGNSAMAWADAATGASLAFLSVRAPADPDYTTLSDRVRALLDAAG